MSRTAVRRLARPCGWAAALGLAAVTCSAAALGEVVAVYDISPSSGGFVTFTSASQMAAQTFTPTSGGPLGTISVALAASGSSLPERVLVGFRFTIDGTPAPTELATASIDGHALAGVQPGAPRLFTADFGSFGISLTAGATYAFTLRTDTAAAFASGSRVPGYAAGASFVSEDSGLTWFSPQPNPDVNFRVVTVPEPSVALLLAPGLVAIAWRSGRGETAQRTSGTEGVETRRPGTRPACSRTKTG